MSNDTENRNEDLPEGEAVDATASDPSFLSFLPGQRLKKARDMRGMTVAQVARELYISERYLQAIEADNYALLPEPAFVRGYMRRYAQLVQLSPDDIVAGFDESYAADSRTPEPDTRPLNPVQLLGDLKEVRLPWGRLFSLASLLLLLVLLAGAIFWKGIGSSDTPVVAVPDAVPVVPADVPAPDVTATAAASVASPATEQTLMTTLPAPATASVLPAPASATPVVAAPAVASGSDTVVLTFSGDCWISVRDASGRELAGGTRKQGETLPVSGTGPLFVSVGNVGAVSVVFNGKPVDLTPFTRANVANLKLAR